MKLNCYCCLFFLSYVSFFIPAFAKTSDWENFSEGQIRIILSPEKKQLDNNEHWKGAVEINLNNGWHTYWRFPGASGIAPSLNFGSHYRVNLFYPVPKFINSSTNNWAIGYDHHVLLPFSITGKSKEPTLKAEVFLGICNQMCVPIHKSFLFVKTTTDSSGEDILDESFSNLPKKPTSDFHVVSIKQKNDFLMLLIKHPKTAKAPIVYLDTGSTLVGKPQLTKTSSYVTSYRVSIFSFDSIKYLPLFYTISLKEHAINGKVIIPIYQKKSLTYKV